jgi:hypothetical protein
MPNDPLFPTSAFRPLSRAELFAGEAWVTNDNGWVDAVAYDNDSEAA